MVRIRVERRRSACAARALGIATLLLAVVGCGRNPVLGTWEIDRDANERGVLVAVEAAELATLRFDGESLTAAGREIPLRYVMEDDVVRLVRADGRGEHRARVLDDGRIEVELPIGVSAVYRRGSS